MSIDCCYCRYCRPLALLLFAAHLLTGSTVAQSKAVDADQIDATPASLTEYFAVLEDPTLELTLAEV